MRANIAKWKCRLNWIRGLLNARAFQNCGPRHPRNQPSPGAAGRWGCFHPRSCPPSGSPAETGLQPPFMSLSWHWVHPCSCRDSGRPGSWHHNHVKDICRAISDRGYGIDLHSTTRHLFHSLAISLWVGTLRYGSTGSPPSLLPEMGWCSPFYLFICTISCFAFATTVMWP